MKKDENKKSGRIGILIGAFVAAGVCLCLFWGSIDGHLREFFKNSGTSEVESYVIYSKEKKPEKSEDGQPGLIPVPYVEMTSEFPTGCESSGAVMLLRYSGVDIELKGFVDDYLTCSALKVKKGEITGCSPDEAFIGNPREEGGYGCYAAVIEESLKKIISEQKDEKKNLLVKNITGVSMKDVEKYVKEGIPVLIWATGKMAEPTKGTTWKIKSSGKQFTWLRGEHCLVMTGVDEKYYYFSDPLWGEGVSYEKSLVEKRYKQLGSQGIVILSGVK